MCNVNLLGFLRTFYFSAQNKDRLKARVNFHAIRPICYTGYVPIKIPPSLKDVSTEKRHTFYSPKPQWRNPYLSEMF